MSGDRAGTRSWSLASRLTGWYALSAFASLAMFAAFLDWGLTVNLESDTVMLAERERQELARILDARPLDFEEIREEVERTEDEDPQTRVWVRVARLGDGAQRVESRGMSALGMDENLVPFPDAASASWSSGTSIQLPAGTDVRAFSATKTVPGGDRFRIQIFVEATRLERIETEYRHLTIVLLVLAFCGYTVIGYAIARRGLAPLRRITAAMADIHSSTMDRRVDLSALSEELRILATAFNDVLDRLDDAFTRLERSAADIAHELRTPLTRMRLAAEVALNSPGGAEKWRDALRNCLEEASELTQLIERVLFLARADEPFTPEQGESIDVESELREVSDFYGAPAATRGIVISTDAAPMLMIRGDRGLLLRAISNLIENSMSHTPNGGSIELQALRRDGRVEIRIHDTGCGIPGDQLARVFEPFARVDAARSAESGGAGLGLAIAKKVVGLHRGTISIESSSGTGTTVTIDLPCAQ